MSAHAIPEDVDGALAWLRDHLGAQRVTLRLADPVEVYPVRHEALAPGVASLRTPPPGLDMARQPVAHRLLAGEDQIVQDDTRSASDDPDFQAMLGLFGGLAAQVVTALRGPGGELLGMVSVHDLQGPRAWTAEETAACRDAVAAIGRSLA